MIDPTIWADEDFGRLSTEAQVLFIGIISNSDDEGRLPGNPMFLASVIFPFRGYTKIRATKVRDEVISSMQSVKLYEIDGKEYIELEKFSVYQSIDKPSPSKYPPFGEHSGNTRRGLSPNRIEENRREEKGSSSKKKLYYHGLEIRKSQGKIWVITKGGGKWFEFAGKEEDIVLK